MAIGSTLHALQSDKLLDVRTWQANCFGNVSCTQTKADRHFCKVNSDPLTVYEQA